MSSSGDDDVRSTLLSQSSRANSNNKFFSIQMESSGLIRHESISLAGGRDRGGEDQVEEEEQGLSCHPLQWSRRAAVKLVKLVLHRPHINPRDRLLLSPWQKWKKYNRIPWKVVLHVLVFLVVLTQVVLLYVETAKYNRSAEKSLSYAFLGDDLVEGIHVYAVKDLKELLYNTTNMYYNIQTDLVGKFVHKRSRGNVVPPQLEVQAYTIDIFNETSNSFEVDINQHTHTAKFLLTLEHPLGPYNSTDQKVLASQFQKMIELRVSFHLLSLNIGLIGPIPYDWHITLKYKKIVSDVSCELLVTSTIAEIDGYNTLSLFISFHSFVLFLGMLVLILDFRALFSQTRFYWRVRKKYKSIPARVRKAEAYPLWKEIRWQIKAKFLKLWTFWSLLTGSLLLVGASLGLLHVFGYEVSLVYRIFQGLGAFGITINLLRYFEYIQSLYTLLLTLRVSFAKILRLIIDSLPFFFAYVLLGVTLFSEHSVRFNTIQDTSVLLFSLLNGDAIRGDTTIILLSIMYYYCHWNTARVLSATDAFVDLQTHYPYPWVAEIYLYTFVALFITAILNVFIFIIEDAYHTAKESRTANKAGEENLDGGLGGPAREGHGGHKRKHRRSNRWGDRYEHFSIHDLFHVLEREFGRNSLGKSQEQVPVRGERTGRPLYLCDGGDDSASYTLSSDSGDSDPNSGSGAAADLLEGTTGVVEEEYPSVLSSSSDGEDSTRRRQGVVSPPQRQRSDGTPGGTEPSVAGSDNAKRPGAAGPMLSITVDPATPRKTESVPATQEDSVTSRDRKQRDLLSGGHERGTVLVSQQHQKGGKRRPRRRSFLLATGAADHSSMVSDDEAVVLDDFRLEFGSAIDPKKMKLQLNKLKEDLSIAVLETQEEFFEEVEEAVRALQSKYSRRMKKRMNKEFSKAFGQLSPAERSTPARLGGVLSFGGGSSSNASPEVQRRRTRRQVGGAPGIERSRSRSRTRSRTERGGHDAPPVTIGSRHSTSSAGGITSATRTSQQNTRDTLRPPAPTSIWTQDDPPTGDPYDNFV